MAKVSFYIHILNLNKIYAILGLWIGINRIDHSEIHFFKINIFQIKIIQTKILFIWLLVGLFQMLEHYTLTLFMGSGRLQDMAEAIELANARPRAAMVMAMVSFIFYGKISSITCFYK